MNLNRPIKVEGISVTVGAGIELVVSAFNIEQTIETADDRAALRASVSSDSKASLLAMVHIAGVALRANYPDLTDDMIRKELKPDDLGLVLLALKKANGGADAGEAKAGETPASQQQQTGTDSQPSSA